jgi:hypothetical protein
MIFRNEPNEIAFLRDYVRWLVLVFKNIVYNLFVVIMQFLEVL